MSKISFTAFVVLSKSGVVKCIETDRDLCLINFTKLFNIEMAEKVWSKLYEPARFRLLEFKCTEVSK